MTTDKGLLRTISENATNAANALGEKIKENFLNPAEPPTPEPATPEPPREELVWAQDDLQLFHTYLRKGKQVVYYQNARRVHLDIVYVDPRKPGFIGRVIEGAFDYGFDGSASGAFFGGFSGSLVGLAVGSAVGAVAAATGTTPPKPEPKPEPRYQISLETDDLPEPVVLCFEKSKRSANVNYLAPLVAALKKDGVKPEIWRGGEKCWSRSVSFSHF